MISADRFCATLTLPCEGANSVRPPDRLICREIVFVHLTSWTSTPPAPSETSDDGGVYNSDPVREPSGERDPVREPSGERDPGRAPQSRPSPRGFQGASRPRAPGSGRVARAHFSTSLPAHILLPRIRATGGGKVGCSTYRRALPRETPSSVAISGGPTRSVMGREANSGGQRWGGDGSDHDPAWVMVAI